MEGSMAQNGIGCLVLIGSNQEWSRFSSKDVLALTLRYLWDEELYVTSVSRFYETPAFPKCSGPNYVNAAVAIRSRFDADSTLKKFHEIEQELGRIRETRWGQRTVDIDLISYGDLILPNEATQVDWVNLPLADQMRFSPDILIVPHPRLQDRAFVLGPLMDIAPDWRHPVTHLTVRQMYEALPSDVKDELEIL
jgi:2-amino-4-hydroxy-6-hydroxymethyldihydropteridine diphosphokinase